MLEFSPFAIALISTALLLFLILIRLPIALALGIAGFLGYAWMDGWGRAMSMVSSIPVMMLHGYSLSVVPMFLLMGAIAASSGLSSELFEMAKAMSRSNARGILATATIAACGVFGAICGSSLATAATFGRIAIPEMRAAGYSQELAAGSVAAGGTLGILIPPSVILVIYALLAEESVPALFAASMLPGILLTFLFIVVAKCMVMVRPDWAPPVNTHYKRGDRIRTIARAWKVIVIFVVSIGGIYFGWFSPTEAAAVGAGLAIVIGFADRRLSVDALVLAVKQTVVTSASLFFIFICALMYGRFIALTRLPNDLVTLVQSLGVSPSAVALIIVAIYLVLGSFLESVSMVLITVPVFLPLIQSVGYDAVWFGVMIVVAVEMGLIHPPLGMNLFVIRTLSPDLSLKKVIVGALPFLSAQFVLVFVLVFWPQFTTILPKLLLKQ